MEADAAAVVAERRLEWIFIGKLSVWSFVKLDSLPLLLVEEDLLFIDLSAI